MDLAALLKKNIVMIPVVASVLVGTFTGVKYIVNLTDTINANKSEIQAIQTMELENIRRDVAVLTEKTNTILQKLERAEGTWEMAENLYEVLANRVNEMEWDIKDLNREINY
jgi:peptidoglycan hydrolase CwlO-like protein|tara:strand:+ start:264 stop:599 length:336 start_codon:yes stop_codon:yes gene_type:complete